MECAQRGKCVLTTLEKKEIDSFYLKYFHIRHSAHLYYKNATGQFNKLYIPNGIHSAIIDRYFNDWSKASVIDNKCYYPRLFGDVKLPQMVAYRLGNIWYNGVGEIISFEIVLSLLRNFDELFLKKANDSWGGLGVHYYSKGKETLEELQSIILHLFKGDLVIQECVHQSEAIAQLNPSSVNTIRIMSRLYDDGTVKIYSSVLRMGVGNSKVDNASSGGISTGIQDDGRLKNVAYSNTGIRYDVHPSSNVHFEEVVIPNFDKMKEMVMKLHPRFPHFRLISWDLACDYDNEPVLIEANLCDGELDFHQLNNGPIFGDETEAVLKEVFENYRIKHSIKIVQIADNIVGAILHERMWKDVMKV